MLAINFTPCPSITTERLLIRQITQADAPNLFALRTDERVMQYVNRPRPQSVEHIKNLITQMNQMIAENISINWGIFLQTAPQNLLGMISFHRIEKEHYRAEIGYILHPNYWGQGIVSEGIKGLLAFGFNEMGLNSIEAHIRPENGASRQVLLKNHFVKEASLRQNVYFEGRFLDTEIYSILKEDYLRERDFTAN